MSENIVGSAFIELRPSIATFVSSALAGLSGSIRPIEQSLTGMFSKSATAAGGVATEVGLIEPGLNKAALGAAGFGAAIVGTALVTGKMATSFQAAMEMVHTQAGVGQEQIAGLSKGVLNLAGQVGINPDSLAEALFHVESTFEKTGMSGQKAMELLRTASEGARVGNANLVDVTNALDATIVSGIGGIKDYDSAMGELNATVGIGDMTMQNLADALSTGVMAVIKGYGVTLHDASAALAVFGDNNIRGSIAGNQLRMAVQSLTNPTKAGKANLEALGMTADQLAKDMQHGGLNQALNDLTDHMNKAGITGVKTGEWLTDSFGKRAGAGVNVLVNQIGLFHEALDGVQQASGNFGDAWARTQDTTKQKLAESKAALSALGITIGTYVLPLFNDMAGAFIKAVPYVQSFVVNVAKLVSVVTGTTAFKDFIFLMTNPVAKAGFDALAAVIGVALVIAMTRAGVAATISGAQMVASFVASQVAAVASGVETAIIAGMYIADWIAMAAAATANAVVAAAGWFIAGGGDGAGIGMMFINSAKFVLAWVQLAAAAMSNAILAGSAWLYVTAESAITAVIATASSVAAIVADWILMKSVAIASAVETAIAWLMSAGPEALLAVSVTLASVAAIVADWILMGASATAGAIAIAAAWLLSIAPIVIVVAAIAAAVYLIIHNWDTIRSATETAWHAVSSTVSSAWDSAYAAVTGGISKAVGAVRALPGQIVGALGDVGSMLYNSGARIVQGLIDGIKNMAGNVKNAIGSVLSDARNLLPFSPAKEGPFSGRGWTTYSGAAIVDGLAQGALSRSKALSNAMSDVMGGAASAVGGVGQIGVGKSFPSAVPIASQGGLSHSVAIGNLTLQVNGSLDMTSESDKRRFIKQVRDGLVKIEAEQR